MIGAGLQGKKNCIKLKELGAEVSVYDTDPTTMAWTIKEKFEWVEEIKGDYDGCVIATPPEFHYENLNESFNKIGYIPFLIEKPLALNSGFIPIGMKDWDDKVKNKIMMAHNYLFSLELWNFKKEMIAPLRADRRCEYVSADYLPNWH